MTRHRHAWFKRIGSNSVALRAPLRTTTFPPVGTADRPCEASRKAPAAGPPSDAAFESPALRYMPCSGHSCPTAEQAALLNAASA